MQGVSIGRRWRHSDTHPGNNVWSLQAIWFLNGLVSGLLETADMGGRRIRVWRNSRRERRKPRRFHYFVGMKSRSKKTRSTRKASSSWRKLWSTNRFFLKIGCPQPVQIWSKQWNRNIIIWNNEWTWLATPQLTTPDTFPISTTVEIWPGVPSPVPFGYQQRRGVWGPGLPSQPPSSMANYPQVQLRTERVFLKGIVRTRALTSHHDGMRFEISNMIVKLK